jgi:uncharacterized protein YndB with AHSA1/START domain
MACPRLDVLLAATALLTSCMAHDPVQTVPGANYPTWPEENVPEDCPVYVHNEVTVAAPPAAVWAWLIRADLWPTWFDGATAVSFDKGGPELNLGTQVNWHMIGADIHAEVKRFEPPTRLDWAGGGTGVHAYHTWLIEPGPNGGTHIVTDESEHGFVSSLMRSYIYGKLHLAHQAWIEDLGKVAAKGDPPVQ